jgi:DNA invertase Pin-like site-specific DNA recombinase
MIINVLRMFHAAQLERRRIKERTIRGRADAKAKGVKFGRNRNLRSIRKRRQLSGAT